jgi:hypothetical protein
MRLFTNPLPYEPKSNRPAGSTKIDHTFRLVYLLG